MYDFQFTTAVEHKMQEANFNFDDIMKVRRLTIGLHLHVYIHPPVSIWYQSV